MLFDFFFKFKLVLQKKKRIGNTYMIYPNYIVGGMLDVLAVISLKSDYYSSFRSSQHSGGKEYLLSNNAI